MLSFYGVITVSIASDKKRSVMAKQIRKQKKLMKKAGRAAGKSKIIKEIVL
jgi:hypothetical protein